MGVIGQYTHTYAHSEGAHFQVSEESLPEVPEQNSGQGSVPSCFGRFWDIPGILAGITMGVVEGRGEVAALYGRSVPWPCSVPKVVDPCMPNPWVSTSSTKKQNSHAPATIGQYSLSISFPICK